jgi:hypothetical protein
MSRVERRVSELERERVGPAKVHSIRVWNDDEEAALEDYGREKIGERDMVVLIRQFG